MHRTDLTIFPLTLPTMIIAPMMSIWGKRTSRTSETGFYRPSVYRTMCWSSEGNWSKPRQTTHHPHPFLVQSQTPEGASPFTPVLQCHYPLLQVSHQQITCPNYPKRFPFETVKRRESTRQPANEPKFSWKTPLKWCVHMWDVGMCEFKAPTAKELWKVRTNTQL